MKTTTTCTDCGERITETPLNHAEYGRALCPACRYHSAPTKSQAIEQHSDKSFNEATTKTAHAEHDESDAPRERQERMGVFLRWLAHSGNVERAGERALLLAHVSGVSPFKTDAQLAAKLNITRGRISQLRKEIDAFLPGVNGNRRQKIKSRGRVGR